MPRKTLLSYPRFLKELDLKLSEAPSVSLCYVGMLTSLASAATICSRAGKVRNNHSARVTLEAHPTVPAREESIPLKVQQVTVSTNHRHTTVNILHVYGVNYGAVFDHITSLKYSYG